MRDIPASETWLPVVGFEGLYEVSDAGRVRSLNRTLFYERVDQYSKTTITVARRHRGRILAPAPTLSGHMSVVLGRTKGSVGVHILVLTAFRGPCPEGMECRHLNGIPDQNKLENLQWGTRSENIADALNHGAMPKGSERKGSKLTESSVQSIRALFGIVSIAEIARRSGVNESTIRQVRDGRTWSHA